MTATLIQAPAQARVAAAPIPFTRLLQVEWGKATDTRAARWLIAVSAAAAVLIELIPLIGRHSIDQKHSVYLDLPTLALCTLLPVVSILTLTTEWTQRTVLTTFTQEPRRARVMIAKATVSGSIGVAAIMFGGLVTLAALGIAGSTGRDIESDVGAMQVLGFVLFVLINMMMGVAFGALLHNTAASIVLFFVVPTIFGVLGSAVDAVGRWIDPATTFEWVRVGHWSGHGWQIAVSTGLWLVLPLVFGVVRTLRREIK